MEKHINIRHSGTPFRERSKYFMLMYLGLSVAFVLLYLIKHGIENSPLFIAIIIAIFGTSLTLNILQNKLYLVDFASDSNNVSIRYFNGAKEYKMNSSIRNISIQLKNTSSRSGFNCVLKLTIEGLKFTINSEFDWSLNEMKQVFEYIQYYKQMPLTESDKFNISRIEEKIKKLQ